MSVLRAGKTKNIKLEKKMSRNTIVSALVAGQKKLKVITLDREMRRDLTVSVIVRWARPSERPMM